MFILFVRDVRLFASPRSKSSVALFQSLQLLYAMPNQRLVRQPKKVKDEREWTTPEQKAHLCASQGSYALHHQSRTVAAFFNFELPIYFEKFPTQPVTVAEGILHGQNWSFEDKKQLETKVSLSKCDRK